MVIDEKWTLSYQGKSLTFGSADSDYPLTRAPKFGAPERRSNDNVLPRTDGSQFGREYLDGRSIDFELAALGKDNDDYLGALELAEKFERFWNADELRELDETNALLMSPTGMVVFGRPRTVTLDDDLVRAGGVVEIACSFDTTDKNWYSLLNEERLNFGAQPTGGFVFPAVFPISTIGDEGSGSRSIDVGGTGLAYPVLVVVGPILSPIVEIGRRFWSFPGLNVRDGQTLTIDTQPWNRTIWSNGAPRVPTRGSTPLTRSGLEPGRHVIALRGTSESGSAGLIIRWRNSWSRNKGAL